MRKQYALLVILFLIFQTGAQARIPRFSKVSDGFYRGGQPTDREDYVSLKSLGIRTVVNLRTTVSEVVVEESILRELGIEMVHIPISTVFGPSRRDLAQVFEVLLEEKDGPVFLHCQEGKDRTGLVVGLYRNQLQNFSCKQAWHEMKQNGFNPFLLSLTSYFWNHCEP